MPFKHFFKRNQPQAQPPSSPSDLQPIAVSPWRAQNQETLDELARFIDFADGFTLGFLEINFEDDLDEVLKALRTRRECATAQFHVFNFDDPDLRFLKDVLEEKIQQLPPPVSLLMDEQRVIFVKGLENAIGLFGDYPPVLQDLNFVRDAWIESVPYPVLFCLPSYAINRIIKFAPDFWSWKSGVFKIKSLQSSEDNAFIRGLHANKPLGSMNRLELQEKVQLLEKLSQEFSEHTSKAELRVSAQALVELGILHTNSGNYLKGIEAFKEANKIFLYPNWHPMSRKDTLLSIQLLTWEGVVNLELGNLTVAEQSVNKSLELNRIIKDGFEQGHALFVLGRIQRQQKNFEQAAKLFQTSFEIRARMDDWQGQAAVLSGLGGLATEQGKINEAIHFYKESLKIGTLTNDLRNQSSNLHHLAYLKDKSGEVEESIRLYKESLKIKEHIGDLQGIAATKAMLGQIFERTGNLSMATQYLEEALLIDRRVGLFADAALINNILNRIQRMDGDK